MTAWLWFWAGLLVAGTTVYTILAVAITIGGAGDIRDLLRQLDAQHGKGAKPPPPDRG